MQAPDALPLHLMLAMMQSGSFPSAFESWNNPWQSFMPDWMRPKSPLEQSLDQLQNAWQQLSELQSQWLSPPAKKPKPKPATANLSDFAFEFFNPAFLGELGKQAYAQSGGFMAGIQAYLASDYERPPTNHKILWQRGSAKLYDLAPTARDTVAVLCVPSLINKSHILDLYPEASFVQFLKSQGFRPLLLDWGTPGDEELNFTAADYITGYALDALHELREAHDGPIALLGYCMGGIFTTAMAQLAPMYADALILLATPWDFSAPDTPRVLLEPTTQLSLRHWMGMFNPVPPLITQTVFHLIDPWRVQQKYSRFPSLSEAEKQHFLAVEQWVNDGVPLARAVAEECFVDWPQGNILHEHKWKVGRRWIEPASITCPAISFIPKNDLIVPQGCALPLTQALKRCDVVIPDAGHVSMVVGKRAKEEMWQPLSRWLKQKF